MDGFWEADWARRKREVQGEGKGAVESTEKRCGERESAENAKVRRTRRVSKPQGGARHRGRRGGAPVDVLLGLRGLVLVDQALRQHTMAHVAR